MCVNQKVTLENGNIVCNGYGCGGTIVTTEPPDTQLEGLGIDVASSAIATTYLLAVLITIYFAFLGIYKHRKMDEFAATNPTFSYIFLGGRAAVIVVG